MLTNKLHIKYLGKIKITQRQITYMLSYRLRCRRLLPNFNAKARFGGIVLERLKKFQ